MFCRTCGSNIANSAYCSNCGTYSGTATSVYCRACGKQYAGTACPYCGTPDVQPQQPMPYHGGQQAPAYGWQSIPQQAQHYQTTEYAVYSPKRKLVALLLCIFLGLFGIHRFYIGKVGTGILYLFTYGVFGIGWLVDIITIATGKMTDANGYYIRQ